MTRGSATLETGRTTKGIWRLADRLRADHALNGNILSNEAYQVVYRSTEDFRAGRTLPGDGGAISRLALPEVSGLALGWQGRHQRMFDLARREATQAMGEDANMPIVLIVGPDSRP